MSNLKLLSSYRSHTYHAHAMFILNEYLEKTVPQASLSRTHSKHCINERLILYIDSRPQILLRAVVLNTLLMTGFQYNILILTTQQSLSSMSELFSDVAECVSVEVLCSYGKPIFNQLDVATYNRVLKEPSFWINIGSNKLLIAQADSMLIRPLGDRYWSFDFIGAPWSPGKHLSHAFYKYELLDSLSPREMWETTVFSPGLTGQAFTPVGNGGFSIRSTSLMSQIASKHDSPTTEPEDVFYSRYASRYSQRLANIDEASSFCCETSYYPSVAFHASYLYLTCSEQAKLYETHLKHVIGMVTCLLAQS